MLSQINSVKRDALAVFWHFFGGKKVRELFLLATFLSLKRKVCKKVRTGKGGNPCVTFIYMVGKYVVILQK